MRLSFSLLVFLVSVLSPQFAYTDEQKGDWILVDKTESEAGIVQRPFISTMSTNPIKGEDSSGKVELGYPCGGIFQVRSNDVSFAINKVDCGQYGCKRKQHGKIKFNGKNVNDIELEIWPGEKNGMYVMGNEQALVKKMKAASSMQLGVQASNTDGKIQELNFSLMGFTAAYNWCAKK